jgi:hypothetical protein
MSGTALERTVVVLEWLGPFSFRADAENSVFVGGASAASGMYLWTVPTPKGFLIQRIGGTEKPFWMRHHQHLEAFKDGAYPIHRAASLAAGRRDPVYPGLYGDKRSRDLLRSRFHNSWPKLRRELAGTLSLLAIFLAPLDCGRRVRQRIQTALHLRLRALGGQESRFLDKPAGRWLRFPTEGPIVVRSVNDGRVRGLSGDDEA